MRVKLKEICEVLDNQRIPLSKNERAERIKNKSLKELYPYYGATQQAGYIDDYIFDDTLILLGEDGVMFYDRSKPKAYLISGKSWVNNHAHVLKVKEDVAVINYVLYYLNIFDYHGFVSGSTRLKLNKSKMENIEIPLPPLPKQKAIAQKLDLAQKLIDLRKESITKLDELSKSVFVEMFGDPVENEMGWEVMKLKDFTDVKTGKTPSRKEPLFWENGTELWATTTEVNKKYITDTDEKITMYAVEKNNLTVYPKHTILMAMYGQGKTRGKVAELMVGSTINQAFCAILRDCKINCVNPPLTY